MPLGRCSGCGVVHASAKYMSAHVLECSDYKLLYKQDPDRALSPAEEQKRYMEEDGKLQAKELQSQARQVRADTHRSMNDRKLDMEHERWSTQTTHRSTSRPVTTPDEGQSWRVKRDEVVPESLVDLGKRVAAWRFNRLVQ